MFTCCPCRLEDGISVTGYGEKRSRFAVPGESQQKRASGRRYEPTLVENEEEDLKRLRIYGKKNSALKSDLQKINLKKWPPEQAEKCAKPLL